MALWIGIGIGLVFAVGGWAIYVFAPKVGPNPIFGVRAWYSMVNVEVWDESNRVGGILFAAIGALLILLTLAVQPWIDPDTDGGILTIVGIVLALTIVGVAWLVLYTRRLAQGHRIVGAEVIRVSPWWLLPSALATAGVTAFLFLTSAELPAENVATEFDASGDASRWMSRSARTGVIASRTRNQW